ncbi:MAG: SpoIIE family protein phosphatase [Flavobacteriales bacterium]|nr:SpoIIE family protein phosphatase [Flavobacteriales bacterium]
MQFVRSIQTSQEIVSLRLSNERRIFRFMGLAMGACAGAWMLWCTAKGYHQAALIPASYLVITCICLGSMDHPSTRRWSRRCLLIAGLLLPFAFQYILGGAAPSGMVMLWSLPTLVVSVNLQSGILRYAYLVLTGLLLTAFTLWDPALNEPWAYLGIAPNVLLAFNLGSSMLTNFILADRMLFAQRRLRKHVFAIQKEEQERFLNTLEERNRDMQQSLDYAGRIQMALWPDRARLSGLFRELHVHYDPKEAVGGDLMWHARVEDRSYFIVLDCTGHGVPGSLMSMLMHGLLNEVVHTGRNLSAVEVVRRTQQLLSDRLDRDRTGNTDGAEMAVLCFDHGRRLVSCCAYGCGILVQEGSELVHLRSHSGNAAVLVGARLNELNEHIIRIGSDTRIFMYTDGVADQFCAEDRHKFTRARLERTLHESSEMAPDAQMTHFQQVFSTWRGETPMVDDTLLVSIVPAACWHSLEEEDLQSDAA